MGVPEKGPVMKEGNAIGIAVEFNAYEDILRKHLPYAGDAPLVGSSVLADLGLNSLGIVRLLAEMESAFDIELPDETLTPQTFETVDSLWRVVSAETSKLPD